MKNFNKTEIIIYILTAIMIIFFATTSFAKQPRHNSYEDLEAILMEVTDELGNYKSQNEIDSIIMKILAVEEGLSSDYFKTCNDKGADCYYTEVAACRHNAEMIHKRDSQKICLEGGKDKDCEDIDLFSGNEGYEVYTKYLNNVYACNY